MKKLFLMAAIVGAAVCAQATTLWSWNVEGFKDRNGSDYSGYATLYAYPADGEESSAKAICTDAEAENGTVYVSMFKTDLLPGTYKFYFTAEDEDGYTFKSETIEVCKEDWEVELELTTGISFVSPHESGTWTQVPELPELRYLAPVYVGGVAANGIDHWVTNTVPSGYTIVTSATERVTWGTAGETSWYVVTNGTFQIGSVQSYTAGIECYGNVHLVLCDGAKLTVTSGYMKSAGIETDASGSFTIYGTPDGAGELLATGGINGAGIGGDLNGVGSNITINGGKVTATGGCRAGAGIGGGQKGQGNNIVINGGTVTATGGTNGAAGIGGGQNGQGNNIVINGGTVTAIGGTDGAAGIGGGYNGESGSHITINGGTITAVAGKLAAAIGGGCAGSGSNIAINGGTIFVNARVFDLYLWCECPDFIGKGLGSDDNETIAENNTISSAARVFFNATGVDVEESEELDVPAAPMPETFEGNFVVMTPATQAIDRVLIGGCDAQALSILPTFVLTNAVTGATGEISVDAGAHTDFANTFLRLMSTDGNLTLKIDALSFTITQQPTVANDYTIAATTDGSDGITNYAWCVMGEVTIDFHSLTNTDILMMGQPCDDEGCLIAEGTTIPSGETDTSYNGVALAWAEDALPSGGVLNFTGPSALTDIGSELGFDCGTLTKGEGDSWSYALKLCEDDYIVSQFGCPVWLLLLGADEKYSIGDLTLMAPTYTPVAEGSTLTQFPADKGVGGSTYVCRVTYGHRGTFYTANSETFVYPASTTYPAYVAALPDVMKQKFDTWATTFGSRDPDGVYTNAFLLNVATNDEAKAIAAFKITSIVATNENEVAVAEVGKPVPLPPSTFFNGELWYQAATNLAADAVWTDLVEGSYTWDSNTFFRAKLDLTHPDAPTVPTTSEAGRSIKFRPVE